MIPQSWYPDSTPTNIEKWKIPSCEACNAAYGILENELLLRLGLCLDPNEVRAAGISAKALRSIKPEFAKNARDRRAREAKRHQILSELFPVDENTEGLLPGLGISTNSPSLTAIPVPGNALVRFGEKLARGITYLETGILISPEYQIEVNFVHEHNLDFFEDLMRQHATKKHRGPGVALERAALPADPLNAIFRVSVWGQIKFYLSVFNTSLAEAFDEGSST